MQLHKLPDGLLGALNLKTTGQNPNQLSDAISGTLDLIDWYLRDFLTMPAPVGGNMTNPGDGIVLTVPGGVMWRVLSIGIAIIPDAADAALRVYGRFDARTETGLGLNYLQECGPIVVTPELRNANFAMRLNPPLLLKAGSVIGFRSETQYTMPALGSLNIQYQAIPL